MSEGKEPRPGMACDGWAACDRPSCYLCCDKQEGSCKSCWEKTLAAFRTADGLRALMKSLGRVCRFCEYYDRSTGVCQDNALEWPDEGFCSFWFPNASPEAEESNDPQ